MLLYFIADKYAKAPLAFSAITGAALLYIWISCHYKCPQCKMQYRDRYLLPKQTWPLLLYYIMRCCYNLRHLLRHFRTVWTLLLLLPSNIDMKVSNAQNFIISSAGKSSLALKVWLALCFIWFWEYFMAIHAACYHRAPPASLNSDDADEKRRALISLQLILLLSPFWIDILIGETREKMILH